MDSKAKKIKENKTPLISVVMGCYNSSEFISEAIDSILTQTIDDFEFIIIDDCSKDNTVEIIKSYNDPRIILVQNAQNMGLGYSLNLGVSMSKGKYIARMDADDISLPERFEKQVDYLVKNPDYLVLASACIQFISENGIIKKKGLISKQLTMEGIRAHVLFGVPFIHPTVMFNAELLYEHKLNYNASFKKAQDYELWSRIVWNYKVANIKEPTLLYRISNSQASVSCRDEQINYSKSIWKNVLRIALQNEVEEKQIRLHYLSTESIQLNSDEQLLEVLNWKLYLYNKSLHNNYIDSDKLLFYLSNQWLRTCKKSLPLSKRLFWFNKLPLPKPYALAGRLYFELLFAR